MILPLYSVLTCGVLSPVLGSPVQERDGVLGLSPVKDQKDVRGQQHLACKEMLRELGLLHWEKRNLREILSMVINV